MWRWDQQEPFGVNVPDENPSSLGAFEFPLRFPGQYADKETGNYDNWFHTYSPALGGYPHADPLGIATSWPRAPTAGLNHLYSYVNANPLRAIDPQGLLKWTGDFGGVGASDILGGGLYAFELTSECACGKQVRVSGFASGVGAGVGVLKYSASVSASEFETFGSCPRGSDFNGLFAIISIGAGPGGCAAVRLGGAASVGCGRVEGVDLGLTVQLGASAVVSEKEECCK